MADPLFEQIATDAIEAAEDVDVEFSEFVEGLEVIVSALKSRLEWAREELGNR